MFTYVKSKWPQYGDKVLYFLVCASCLFILVYVFTGFVPFRKAQNRVTIDNIESNIKQWCENFGMPFTKTIVPDTYFAYNVTTRSGNPLIVSRLSKERQSYLQFGATVTFSPERRAAVNTMTKDELDELISEVTLQLTTLRMGVVIATLTTPQTGNNVGQTVIGLQKAVPINDLNEPDFGAALDDIESGINMSKSAVSLGIRRIMRERKQSSLR